MITRKSASALVGAVCGLVVLSCDNPTNADRTLAEVEIVSGDGQTGTVGKELAVALRVRALDDAGNPLALQPLSPFV